MKTQEDLSVIQKAHDLILWYVPLLNRLPRDQKFILGDRLLSNLYELYEGLSPRNGTHQPGALGWK